MKSIFNSILLSCIALTAMSCQSAEASFQPENSKLFEKRVDPVSGVVSYALKYGAADDNKQSLYFISKSMTEDGRYLVFKYNEGNEQKGMGKRYTMLADLHTDTVYNLGEISMTPYIETRQNYIVYGDLEKGFFRRDFNNPGKEIKLCDVPEELSSLGKVIRLATHLTLTQDRKKAFLDAAVRPKNAKDRYIQGMLNLETGEWELWGETEWNCNHGQLNPTDDSLAMCAWESAWEGLGKEYMDSTGLYPRMWLVRKGEKTMIPAKHINFASHEIWDDDGKGFSWCGHGWMVPDHCVYHHDLETGEQEVWAAVEGARHNSCSPDNKYVVIDQAPNNWWRGCQWRVAFYNRETEKYVWLYSTREALNPQSKQSRLHPDPHPHFVMGGRYVISTANNADGHMDLYLTPVDQLIEMTSAEAQQFRSVGVEEFAQIIKDPQVTVLDVRTAAEYAEGHIDGTDFNIDVRSDDFDSEAFAKLPKANTVALYCRSGNRSKVAAQRLVEAGYQVVELGSGYLGWTKR